MARSQRWGWHRLDDRWAEQLVAAAPIGPRSLVLDIGAGTGVIAARLLDVGAQVIAVEAHPQRARQLRERFGSDLVVVQVDAADLRLPRRPFHVVSNPPFAITAAVLRRIVQPGSRLLSARIVVQAQAAARWTGPTAPAIRRWGAHFEVAMGSKIPRRAFTPPPQVDARILNIDSRRRSSGGRAIRHPRRRPGAGG